MTGLKGHTLLINLTYQIQRQDIHLKVYNLSLKRYKKPDCFTAWKKAEKGYKHGLGNLGELYP